MRAPARTRCLRLWQCAAAALLPPALLLLALPSAFPSHCLRIALGFLGLGWCHPTPLPRLHHAFPPPPAFLNDSAFWRAFPCPRSAYTLYLPEGAPASPAPPPCAGTLIVTAFFDIGRARWPFLARATGAYLEHAEAVLALSNPLFLATSPDLAPRLAAARRQRGLMDRTLILAHDVHCGAGMARLPRAASAMCSAQATRAWRLNPYLAVPERQEPLYNALMWMKAGLLQAGAALSLPPLAAPRSVTWLDLGCHPPMCAQGVVGAGVCLAPRLGSPGRLRVARAGATAEGMEEGAAGAAALRAGPAAWVRQHRVVLAGTVFGALRGDVPALMRAFQDALEAMLAEGVADTDQSVLFWMYAQHPELFDAYSVGGDWHRIVSDY
jgi:hypothetical protein